MSNKTTLEKLMNRIPLAIIVISVLVLIDVTGCMPSGNSSNGETMAQNWRNHPLLKGRFHKDYPDDVQVIVHDGGPRFTDKAPELVWVRVTGVQTNTFTGRVLNQPVGLKSVQQGSEIQFIVPNGSKYPILVTQKYLNERDDWVIQPCDKCGLSELFDAPSDLVKLGFSGVPDAESVEAFTTHCPIDGGVMVVARKGSEMAQSMTQQSKKQWWQFWVVSLYTAGKRFRVRKA